MKKILITGGIGYVGGRIIQHLLMVNPGITIDISSRREVDVNKIFNSDRVFLINSEELRDPGAPLRYVYDAIVHLAATNEIDAVVNTPESIQVNILNSYILLQKAIAKSIKRFLYFSTAHIYGSPLKGIISEEVCPKPMHPYAITHKAFEDFLWAANQKQEIEGISVRLSNSFGPPAHAYVNRWTLLVNDLCRQAVTNKKIVLKSTGTQLRDFITLQDVSAAVEFLLNLDPVLLKDGIYNLGGNQVMSVFQMAEIIQQRAQLIFGVFIPIERTEKIQTESVLPFEYISKKLADNGFKWGNNSLIEIDATLKFCNEHFN